MTQPTQFLRNKFWINYWLKLSLAICHFDSTCLLPKVSISKLTRITITRHQNSDTKNRQQRTTKKNYCLGTVSNELLDNLQSFNKILTSINELCCVLSRNTICKEYHTRSQFHIHVHTHPISAKYQTSLPKVITLSNIIGFSQTIPRILVLHYLG